MLYFLLWEFCENSLFSTKYRLQLVCVTGHCSVHTSNLRSIKCLHSGGRHLMVIELFNFSRTRIAEPNSKYCFVIFCVCVFSFSFSFSLNVANFKNFHLNSFSISHTHTHTTTAWYNDIKDTFAGAPIHIESPIHCFVQCMN